MKELRADGSQRVLFAVLCRIFCLPVYYEKNTKIKYRTTTLTVVPYGCETWSVTLTVDRRLTVFENRALRKLFGPKRDEVTGQWIRLHNKELYACTPLQVLFG